MSSEYNAVAALVPLLFILFFFLAFVIMWGTYNTRTREYRRTLTDMYVSAKIRQIADKDKINLTEEYNKFLEFKKKQKIDYESFDETIERELKDEVGKEVKIK